MKTSPGTLSDIFSYRAVGEKLGTAGQPTEEQFRTIRDAGFAAVINLALPTSDNALANEGSIVTGHGMAYVHIPVDFKAPAARDFDAFCNVMKAFDGRPVFVHCAANMRVSAFVFLYRVLGQGVAVSEAERDLHAIWQPDEIWSRFIQEGLKRCHPGTGSAGLTVTDIALKHLLVLLSLLLLTPPAHLHGADSPGAPESEAIPLIKPAESTGTGLLLQPPLDLSRFTTEEFVALSSTVGTNRIHKQWISPVVTLPPHARLGVSGLTEQEVKAYMTQVRRLFDEGAAIPISDVGLISTQEDVIRRPMLNHISAFSNAVARVYLLVQKTSTDKGWGYFSIVQDLTTEPPQDYFADLNGKEVKFEGATCYKCHSSGPLAIHPARADLVSDAPLAAAISRHIAKQPLSRFHFPPGEKPPDYGKPIALEFCTKCHDTDGSRLPLFRVHSHPIRVLVDFGYMPPKRRLTPVEVSELKAWLESKP